MRVHVATHSRVCVQKSRGPYRVLAFVNGKVLVAKRGAKFCGQSNTGNTASDNDETWFMRGSHEHLVMVVSVVDGWSYFHTQIIFSTAVACALGIHVFDPALSFWRRQILLSSEYQPWPHSFEIYNDSSGPARYAKPGTPFAFSDTIYTALVLHEMLLTAVKHSTAFV